MSRDDVRTMPVEKALDEAARLRATGAFARLTTRRFFEAGFKNGEVETLQLSANLTLDVRLFVDGRFLEASTSDLAGVPQFVGRCIAAARLLDPDDARRLPDPEWTRVADADLAAYDAEGEAAGRDALLDLARRADAACRAASGDVFHAESTLSRERFEVKAASTAGWSGSYRGTSSFLSARAYVRDGEHKKQVDGSVRSGRRLADASRPDDVGREAAERAIRARGAGPVPTGTYDLIVENRTAGWLIHQISGPLSGRTLHRGQSFLAGRLGQPIAAPCLTITDDPLFRGGLASRPFDSEGLGCRTRPVVEKGVLRSFNLDTYYGRKLGMTPTTGGFSNVVVEPGSRAPAAMAAGIEKGLWVTRFLGGNSNSLTGDFSAGVAGFLVEKGRVGRPVAEVNVAGRLQDLLLAVAEVGDDPYPYSSIRMPSLLVRGIAVSGT